MKNIKSYYLVLLLVTIMIGCMWTGDGNKGLSLVTVYENSVPVDLNSAFKLKYPNYKVDQIERLYMKNTKFIDHYYYHYIKPDGSRGSVGLFIKDNDVVFHDISTGDIIK